MLRKPFVLVFIRFGCWRGIMGNCYENNLATEDTEDTEKKKQPGPGTVLFRSSLWTRLFSFVLVITMPGDNTEDGHGRGRHYLSGSGFDLLLFIPVQRNAKTLNRDLFKDQFFFLLHF
jgi:hypothetical protein